MSDKAQACIQRFVIPGTLPGANQYIDECRRHSKAAARLKRQAELGIAAAIRKAKVRPVSGTVIISYHWIEPTKRRDKDNIAFAQKFIQDALVGAKILQNDGWQNVAGFTHSFAVDKVRPRIEVTIEEST